MSALSELLLEGCWLLAAFLTPLLFSPFSEQGFEPVKAALVRTLALVVAALWFLRWLADRNTYEERSLVQSKLAIAAGFFLLAQALASVLSILPLQSLFGSPVRAQGLYTTLSYATIAAAVAVHLRTPAQRDRLFGAIILSAALVSAYAILQALHLDPGASHYLTSPGQRPGSTFGNPVFMAGFLVMVLPITVWRACDELRYGAPGQGVMFSGLAYVQCAAVLLSDSRGPQLGLLVGAIAWAAWLLRARVLLLGPALLVGAAIAVMVLPGRFEARQGSVGVRLHLWELAIQTIAGPTAPWFRPLVGYGPDVEYEAMAPLTFADTSIVATAEQWDRPHQQVLQVLLEAGLFGLVAYGVVLWTADGLLWRRRQSAAVVALGLGLLINLVDMQVGFVTAVTGLYFWLYLGVLQGLVSEQT